MTLELTYDEVVADLRALAAERPDYTYNAYEDGDDGSCIYFHHDGTPSCIVGHVLAKHGVTLEDVGSANDDVVEKLVTGGIISGDSAAMGVLDRAQGAQDSGRRWADAVEFGILGKDPDEDDEDEGEEIER